MPAAGSGQQIGELAIDLFQDRGSQQQPTYFLALPLQHLSQQVLGDGPLAAGELGREPLRVRVPGQRQGSQPQPGRPALGPRMQQLQGRPRQLHSRRSEQLPGLSQAEPQVRRADLGELSLQPQPVQPQPQIMPGRQHEPQLRRGAHQQQLKLAQRLGRPQLVHVVDTSQSRSCSGARSFSSRSTTVHPSRSGTAVSSRTSLDPAEVWRNAPSTDSQNRCGSRSSRPIATHPVLSIRPASPIHDRSSTDFPLPGGAETTVTRADAPSRLVRSGRETTPLAPV